MIRSYRDCSGYTHYEWKLDEPLCERAQDGDHYDDGRRYRMMTATTTDHAFPMITNTITNQMMKDIMESIRDGRVLKKEDTMSADNGVYIVKRANFGSAEELKANKIIYNNPATIVFWNDGTKTIVKRAKGTPFNKYHAFCAAVCKKIYGSNSALTKIVESGIDQTPKKVKKATKKKEEAKANG